MKRVSIDNGISFVTPTEALHCIDIDTMSTYMIDTIREQVHAELVPCTDIEFLTRYLELANNDLIIG